MTDVVKIEQRLQDPPKIAMLSLDEAIALFGPLMIGLLARHLIPGVIVGIVVWQMWKRLKGDGGLEWLAAAAYWFLPQMITPYRSLPDSSVSLWRG